VLGDADGPPARPELEQAGAWWRTASHPAVGQIYLPVNPLLREPLLAEPVKPQFLGHFGTVPGLNPVWAHANR
jgi:xylulose-5-phosphate/fructose-6-phosphate phosphoketolase